MEPNARSWSETDTSHLCTPRPKSIWGGGIYIFCIWQLCASVTMWETGRQLFANLTLCLATSAPPKQFQRPPLLMSVCDNVKAAQNACTGFGKKTQNILTKHWIDLVRKVRSWRVERNTVLCGGKVHDDIRGWVTFWTKIDYHRLLWVWFMGKSIFECLSKIHP